MSSALEVSPTNVNITPGGEVVWHVTDVADGKLYTPAEESIETDDPMELFNHYLVDPTRHGWLGEGGESSVREVAGYAIKHFNDPVRTDFVTDANSFGRLPDLRANVALSEGLKSVAQPNDIDYDVRGVTIHAAYIPDTSPGDQVQALWLMEKLTPAGELYGNLSSQERNRIRRLYDSALSLVNLRDFMVEYDDFGFLNTMATKMATVGDRGTIVKYDSFASEGWLDF